MLIANSCDCGDMNKVNFQLALCVPILVDLAKGLILYFDIVGVVAIDANIEM